MDVDEIEYETIGLTRTATVKKKSCINRKDALSAVGAIEFPARAILAGIA